jgi:hypothetical protein
VLEGNERVAAAYGGERPVVASGVPPIFTRLRDWVRKEFF